MTRAQSTQIALVGGLAAVTFLAALLSLVALTTGGEVRIAGLRLASVGIGYDRKAEQLMASRAPSVADMAESERLSRLAIAEFPYDTSAWLRISFIDQARNLSLTKVGVNALARSYDLVGVDPILAAWRIHFALENWPNLPNNIRNSVEDEARSMSLEDGGRRKLRAALEAVRNPDVAPLAQQWIYRYVVTPSHIEQATGESGAR